MDCFEQILVLIVFSKVVLVRCHYIHLSDPNVLACNGDRNATLVECPLTCIRTCYNALDVPGPCLRDCTGPGCECHPGFVLDVRALKCVLPEDCSDPPIVSCRTDEVFALCGACPATCRTLREYPPRCEFPCSLHACVCAPGLVRDASRRCIPPDLCPLGIPPGSTNPCGVNEEYSQCGTACPVTCRNMEAGFPDCPPYCIAGCTCKLGYVRNSQNKCVSPSFCEIPPKCGPLEVWGLCTGCPVSCALLRLAPELRPICDAPCSKRGCICEPGLVRSDLGECVPPVMCFHNPVPEIHHPEFQSSFIKTPTIANTNREKTSNKKYFTPNMESSITWKGKLLSQGEEIRPLHPDEYESESEHSEMEVSSIEHTDLDSTFDMIEPITELDTKNSKPRERADHHFLILKDASKKSREMNKPDFEISDSTISYNQFGSENHRIPSVSSFQEENIDKGEVTPYYSLEPMIDKFSSPDKTKKREWKEEIVQNADVSECSNVNHRDSSIPAIDDSLFSIIDITDRKGSLLDKKVHLEDKTGEEENEQVQNYDNIWSPFSPYIDENYPNKSDSTSPTYEASKPTYGEDAEPTEPHKTEKEKNLQDGDIIWTSPSLYADGNSQNEADSTSPIFIPNESNNSKVIKPATQETIKETNEEKVVDTVESGDIIWSSTSTFPDEDFPNESDSTSSTSETFDGKIEPLLPEINENKTIERAEVNVQHADVTITCNQYEMLSVEKASTPIDKTVIFDTEINDEIRYETLNDEETRYHSSGNIDKNQSEAGDLRSDLGRNLTPSEELTEERKKDDCNDDHSDCENNDNDESNNTKKSNETEEESYYLDQETATSIDRNNTFDRDDNVQHADNDDHLSNQQEVKSFDNDHLMPIVETYDTEVSENDRGGTPFNDDFEQVPNNIGIHEKKSDGSVCDRKEEIECASMKDDMKSKIIRNEKSSGKQIVFSKDENKNEAASIAITEISNEVRKREPYSGDESDSDENNADENAKASTVNDSDSLYVSDKLDDINTPIDDSSSSSDDVEMCCVDIEDILIKMCEPQQIKSEVILSDIYQPTLFTDRATSEKDQGEDTEREHAVNDDQDENNSYHIDYQKEENTGNYEDGHFEHKPELIEKPVSCNGDSNALPGCGNYCGRTCNDYFIEDLKCSKQTCRAGACDCKKGFVLDVNSNKCVPPDDCTECGSNEYLDHCPSDCRVTCSSDIEEETRPCSNETDCSEPACVCIFNYRRDFNDECIPIQQCPPVQCKGAHEYYEPCPDVDYQDNCKGPYPHSSPPRGIHECRPACLCADGYCRNVYGYCVSKADHR